MAQQIIPTDHLVPKVQGIGRCNNYLMLQSIPCSPECKIVRKILLDHPLSYALITTTDVRAVYLQQFWHTVYKVPNTKDTIIFKLNTQKITYTVDMFRDTLKLLVETPDNPFITPFLAQPWQTMFKVFNRCLTTRTSEHDQTKINILQLFHVVVNRTNVDYAALLWWDFMNNVFQKKNVIQYPRFIKLIIADLMEKYSTTPRRQDEDYHFIKDDTLLVSVNLVGNVLFQGMQIPDAFLTAEIHATDDYKEYKTVFDEVNVPINQPKLVFSTLGTHRTTPSAHRTPTLTAASPQRKKRKQHARETNDREMDEMAKATILSLTLHKTALAAEAQENIAKVQQKLDEEEIEKMVEGDEDEESYASEFVDSILNDDLDDSDTRMEPGSHKQHSKKVNDDDEKIEKEKKEDEIEKEEKDEDVKKMDVVVKEKDNDEFATGSMETRNGQMQTPIPTPTRSPRKDLSSDKTVSEELTATVSPTTSTISKHSSTLKCKKIYISYKTKILPGSFVGMCRRSGQIRSHIKNKFITIEFFMSKIQEVLDHCNNVVPEMTFAKTNEMIKREMPCLVNLVVNKDREVDPINVQEMISKEFATHGPKMIEELF
ncbi:hypothetical protein Tco_0843884 [Tanacetum coccineum]